MDSKAQISELYCFRTLKVELVYNRIFKTREKALNVRILNTTKTLYQYFDLTGNAEFFYEVVKETVNKSLPEELVQLKKYDRAKMLLSNYIEMPEKDVSLLINTIRDNQFRLSNDKKNKFFKQLSDKEIADIENLIQEVYS